MNSANVPTYLNIRFKECRRMKPSTFFACIAIACEISLTVNKLLLINIGRMVV